MAISLGKDKSGKALPLGWACLGAAPLPTSLALSEDPSIYCLVLVHPFVYLACMPKALRARWVEKAAALCRTEHNGPFHCGKLTAAAYEAYAVPLALPPAEAAAGAGTAGAHEAAAGHGSHYVLPHLRPHGEEPAHAAAAPHQPKH